MKLRQRLSELILFAIIFLGGFAIVRMVLFQPDPIGVATIIVTLVLVGFYRRLSTSGSPWALDDMGTQRSPWPINLASVASDRFEIFPGRPEGYAGYTDYTIMSVYVNDDLAARQPTEQYALLGFGNGFLEGLRSKPARVDDQRRTQFHVVDASQKYKEHLGWLAYLQTSGTDNAGPSTENLHSVVRFVSEDIRSMGPRTMNYWDKVHNKKSESLDSSNTTPDMLKSWTDIYQEAFLEGQRQAQDATIVSVPD
jgi:hypothetical protein